MAPDIGSDEPVPCRSAMTKHTLMPCASRVVKETSGKRLSRFVPLIAVVCFFVSFSADAEASDELHRIRGSVAELEGVARLSGVTIRVDGRLVATTGRDGTFGRLRGGGRRAQHQPRRGQQHADHEAPNYGRAARRAT